MVHLSRTTTRGFSFTVSVCGTPVIFRFVYFLLLSLVMTRVSSAQTPQSGERPRLSVESVYRIGPGDVLQVSVFGRPELSIDAVRVGTDGGIRLPLIEDRIVASCRSEDELSQDIVAHYRDYLRDPQVVVSVKEFSSQVVEVSGAVNRPGSFQLKRRVRVRELIALAGGPSAAASDNLEIARDMERYWCEATETPGDLVLTANLRSLRSGGADNPYVAPGDFVFVPEGEQAFVIGNVYRPTTVRLSGGVTLTAAVAQSGGRLAGSSDKIRVRRKVADNKIETLEFSMNRIQTNGQEDPQLKPGDIVEVGTSLTKTVLKSLMSAAVSASVFYPLVVIQ